MFDTIVAGLAGPGWCVLPGFLTAAETALLRSECRAAHASGGFQAAGVGKGSARRHPEIRGDSIRWVDENTPGAMLQTVLGRFEALRLEVNRSLFLGLFDSELHFAVYPPAAGYRRHLDRFRDDDRRTLTVILYLNEDWRDEDGGQLRFWPAADAEPLDIAPAGGTLVAFLSARFWHEVLPTRRERLSLTGWFRRR